MGSTVVVGRFLGEIDLRIKMKKIVVIINNITLKGMYTNSVIILPCVDLECKNK